MSTSPARPGQRNLGVRLPRHVHARWGADHCRSSTRTDGTTTGRLPLATRGRRIGGRGHDVLRGTDGPDRLVGGSGRDRVNGSADATRARAKLAHVRAPALSQPLRGSSEIFCQTLRDMPVVSVSRSLTVVSTSESCDSSAHSAATLPISDSSSEQYSR